MTDQPRRRTKAPSASATDAAPRSDGEQRPAEPGEARERAGARAVDDVNPAPSAPVTTSPAAGDPPAPPCEDTPRDESPAAGQGGEPPAAGESDDAEPARATEPGAWAALHARRVRARRPGRRGRRAAAPAAAEARPGAGRRATRTA